MARKKRRRNPTAAAINGDTRIDRLASAKTLLDFVKEEFEKSRAGCFQVMSLDPELVRFLQDVKLIERFEHEKITIDKALKSRKPGKPQSWSLGFCERTLLEVLGGAQQAMGTSDALNSKVARESLSKPEWSSLHSILGDRIFCKLLLHHQIYRCFGGARYLQLTGPWRRDISQPNLPTEVKRRWAPAQMTIRRRIFYSYQIGKYGLPAQHPLRMEATETGATRLISWILHPKFESLPKPPMSSAFPSEKKRQRGPRKRKNPKRQRGKETKEIPKTPRPSPISRVVFDVLLEPVQQMLKKASNIDFGDMLSKHCPSQHALVIIKVFEQKSRQLPHLPRISALRCHCNQRESEGAASKAFVKTLACSGGDAEIRFMRDFPALSCATGGEKVGRFLCAAIHEVLPQNLLGKKNWPKLVKTLKLFVHLRNREELSLHDIMQGLSVKDFKDSMIRRFLLKHPGTGISKLGQLKDDMIMGEVLGRLCYFIFSFLAVPLLKAHFYATEAEPGGMQTIYFRKNVWHFLRSRADCGFLHLCLSPQKMSGKKSSASTP